MEENVEYVEREDEFDIQPLEEIHKRRLDQEDEDVDVLTIDPSKAMGEYEVGAFRMPILLDIEASDSEGEVSMKNNKDRVDSDSDDEASDEAANVAKNPGERDDLITHWRRHMHLTRAGRAGRWAGCCSYSAVIGDFGDLGAFWR